MWWILPTGLCTIRYYTAGNSQFTHLPTLPWETAAPQRAAPGCPKVPDVCRTSLSLSYSSLALLVYISFFPALFLFQSPKLISFLWLSSSKNKLLRNNSVTIQPFCIIWWAHYLPSHKDDFFSPTINLNTILYWHFLIKGKSITFLYPKVQTWIFRCWPFARHRNVAWIAQNYQHVYSPNSSKKPSNLLQPHLLLLTSFCHPREVQPWQRTRR